MAPATPLSGTHLSGTHPAQNRPAILDEIFAARKLRVAAAEREVSLDHLRKKAERLAAGRRDFAAALRKGGRHEPGSAALPAVIAELKKASPSKGVLRQDFDVAALARSYAAHGAAALSVLTEPDFFLGDLAYLQRVREACPLPLLRKDFLFCEYQVWEAAAAGADAILLIMAMLEDELAGSLLSIAEQAGLAVLTEVHDEAELERALRLPARIIGVNQRDLRTFAVDTERSARLAARIPADRLRVAESGLQDAQGICAAQAAGFDAVLIGEHFMRAADPALALEQLLEESRRAASLDRAASVKRGSDQPADRPPVSKERL